MSVATATVLSKALSWAPLIVASVIVGALIGNLKLVNGAARPGVRFAARTLLRFGIVLLGLRLSVNDVAGLGSGVLVVIVTTVTVTFFLVQFVGAKLGLSPGLSLLVASGFSICGNSAIASVQGVVRTDDEDVAAAIGLVTLCGTLAIAVVPSLGAALGLSDPQLGIWTGASVQDTAQVIAVASAAGPGVLAVATAVKLTRVLLLAPIVAGISFWTERDTAATRERRGSAIVPLFVVGFLAMMLLRSVDVLPAVALDVGEIAQRYVLAAGAVGLGSTVRLVAVRRLGPLPLVLGAVAWLIVGGVSLLCLQLVA